MASLQWRMGQLVCLGGFMFLWLISQFQLLSRVQQRGLTAISEFFKIDVWAPHELWPAHGGPAPDAGKSADELERTTAADRLARVRLLEEQRNEKMGADVAKEEFAKLVKGAPPVPPLTDPDANTPIVLEISSFLDGMRCARTMASAFQRAANPGRVSIYVLQARDNHDIDCLGNFKEVHLNSLCGPSPWLLRQMLTRAELERLEQLLVEPLNGKMRLLCRELILMRIHAWAIPPEQGMGPVHQRGLANLLLRYSEEDAFCLSMDSHMGFVQNWDAELLQEWSETRNEFAVLTVYPWDITMQNRNITDVRRMQGSYPTFCGYEKEKSAIEKGMPRGRAPAQGVRHVGDKPFLTMNWAAGFSFHRCHAERVVPADMHLKWMFSGEEANRAIRLWTHGYDMYVPTLPIVLHEYANAKQGFWQYKNAQQTRSSQQRLRKLLQMGGLVQSIEYVEPVPPYTLGNQRTIEQFINWSRQDIGETWAPWLKEHGLELKTACKSLERWPVRNEVELVASVAAIPPARGASRLSAFPKGRLELWDGRRWGTVCKTPWAPTSPGPTTLCKQLGYSNGNAFVFGSESDDGGGDRDAEGEGLDMVIGNRECNGFEADMFDCPLSKGVSWELEGCSHAQDVGIECVGSRRVESKPAQHGCCQVSQSSHACANFEYANGCCKVGDEGCEVPFCTRGYWNPTADYDRVTNICKSSEAAEAKRFLDRQDRPPPGGPPEQPPVPVH